MRPLHAITAALLLITGTTVGVLAQDEPEPSPDLVPAELEHAPEDPIEGQNVTFTATVENDGDADVETSFNVTFLVDGEQVGENKTVDGLRFGDSTEVTSDNWTATAGDHEARVVVDAHDDVDEADETNNERIASFTAAAAEVDLVLDELAASPEAPIDGENVTLEATVENEGNVASNTTTVRFFVNGSAFGADVDVPSLAPGENATVSSATWTAVEGEHTIRAFVDPARDIDESDETNNDVERPLTVASDEANLLVDEIELSPEDPEPGEHVAFGATVANEGHSDAGPFNVSVLVDGEEVSNHTVESLGAGNETTVTSDAWNATEGDHTVRIVLDTEDAVNESDEDDNTAQRAFTVASADEDDEDDSQDEGDDESDEADEHADHEAGEDEETITICHIPPGNPDARHTIEIGEPAWDAHEGHGDHKGACESDT